MQLTMTLFETFFSSRMMSFLILYFLILLYSKYFELRTESINYSLVVLSILTPLCIPFHRLHMRKLFHYLVSLYRKALARHSGSSHFLDPSEGWGYDKKRRNFSTSGSQKAYDSTSRRSNSNVIPTWVWNLKVSKVRRMRRFKKACVYFLDSMGIFGCSNALCLKEFSKSMIDKAYT